jgi:hypothetical protein
MARPGGGLLRACSQSRPATTFRAASSPAREPDRRGCGFNRRPAAPIAGDFTMSILIKLDTREFEALLNGAADCRQAAS